MNTINDYFVIYDVGTGVILRSLFIPASDVELNYVDGVECAHLRGEGYYDRHYVSNGKIAMRPKNPTKRNGLSLTNMPHGSVIHIDGAAYEHKQGGSVELRFNLPGVYQIRVERFPFLEKEFEIDYQPQS